MTNASTKSQTDFAVTDGDGQKVRPGRLLIKPDEIRRRIAELAEEISTLYSRDDQTELMIVAVMTGSVVFLSDLIRAIRLPIKMGVMILTSYPGTSTEARELKLKHDLKADIKGKDVLIVDDILDTGKTLGLVVDTLRQREPKSVRSCVLVRKNRLVPPKIEADFVGFEVPDEFVIGYGLDYDDFFRNLPGIAILEKDE